jgi:hypothetical protein
MIGADNVPAAGMGFKWARGEPARLKCAWPGRIWRPGPMCLQAMNIRAAEAIVSNAPKPMKILPISEV